MSLLEDMSSALGIASLEAKGGSGGSGFASTGVAEDTSTGKRYFYKKGNDSADEKMLSAEFAGVKAMHETKTIRVPEPLVFGSKSDYVSGPFVVFEYLNIGGVGDGREMGRKLAQMHRCLSENGKFGFHIDNTIGATPQKNTWENIWPDFFIKHRYHAMLDKCSNLGFSDSEVKEVEEVIRRVLSEVDVVPSLLHGDLWGGNGAFVEGGEPVIYDPATYYGDREADIAMTQLFGGFGGDFLAGYNEEYPLERNFESRKLIYNWYHIANHYVLFGGSYMNQARGMMSQIKALGK
ncbi:hypothetical protein TrVE_jg4634 [Triparma verrucosa]|uniref:protein-ribulosamine 3-kinase n=1 Tax=Triparma verrucosa TaxID=1606542 RepID=A0A9W7C4R0_9STRA|nr:hypothetical protein TrVE_jg4634 [Triparma verrucosa]